MGRIIAIGGGELRNDETVEIDRYIVKATGTDHPKALFIPTASHDSDNYASVFNQIYSKLGCQTDTLYLLNNNITEAEIASKILSSDLVYVGGGDTLFMLDIWKEKRVDIFLKQAFEKEIILSGLSAGAICWFQFGYSDSLMLRGGTEESGFIIIEGLGIINGIACPHFNDETRQLDFIERMKIRDDTGIALTDNCAIEFHDEQLHIIKGDKNAKAYRFYREDNELKMKEFS